MEIKGLFNEGIFNENTFNKIIVDLIDGMDEYEAKLDDLLAEYEELSDPDTCCELNSDYLRENLTELKALNRTIAQNMAEINRWYTLQTKKLLTVKEAAELYGVNEKYMRIFANDHRGVDAYIVANGAYNLISPSLLDEAIARKEVEFGQFA